MAKSKEYIYSSHSAGFTLRRFLPLVKVNADGRKQTPLAVLIYQTATATTVSLSAAETALCSWDFNRIDEAVLFSKELIESLQEYEAIDVRKRLEDGIIKNQDR